VVPWRPGEVRKASAWAAFKAWLANRGGSEPAEARQALAQVRLYNEQHSDSRFDPLDNPEAKPSPNRAGWRKGEGEAREWYVPLEVWKTEICKGLDGHFRRADVGGARATTSDWRPASQSPASLKMWRSSESLPPQGSGGGDSWPGKKLQSRNTW
jgi:hypothetical protein